MFSHQRDELSTVMSSSPPSKQASMLERLSKTCSKLENDRSFRRLQNNSGAAEYVLCLHLKVGCMIKIRVGQSGIA